MVEAARIADSIPASEREFVSRALIHLAKLPPLEELTLDRRELMRDVAWGLDALVLGGDALGALQVRAENTEISEGFRRQICAPIIARMRRAARDRH
jgi:hypothetical protein